MPICPILVTRMISLATPITHDSEKLVKKYVKFEVLMAVSMRNSLLGCDTVWSGRNLPDSKFLPYYMASCEKTILFY